MHLQDVTRADIAKYVQDTLGTNEHFAEVRADPASHQCLLETLVTRSEGVFLWITVALRNCIEGLIEGDTVDDIYRTLDILPTELEDLHMTLLKSTKPQHRVYVYTALQLTAETTGTNIAPLPLLWYYFLDPISSQSTEGDTDALISSYVGIKDEVAKLRIEKELERTRKRLEGRCRGLLATGRKSLHAPFQAPMGPYLNENVELAHRSVRDFFCAPQVKHLMMNELGLAESAWIINACSCFRTHMKLVMLGDFGFLGWWLGPTIQHKIQSIVSFGSCIWRDSRAPCWFREFLAKLDKVLSQNVSLSGRLDVDVCSKIGMESLTRSKSRSSICCWSGCGVSEHLSLDYLLARYRFYEYFEWQFDVNGRSIDTIPRPLNFLYQVMGEDLGEQTFQYGSAGSALNAMNPTKSRVLPMHNSLLGLGLPPDICGKRIDISGREVDSPEIWHHLIRSQLHRDGAYQSKCSRIVEWFSAFKIDLRVWLVFNPQQIQVYVEKPGTFSRSASLQRAGQEGIRLGFLGQF